jgi:thioredoxin reductase (NADPH)
MTHGSFDHEVIIIGGGPAAISASLWCEELGLDSMLLERTGRLGGQLLRTFNHVRNFLGVEAENGTELSKVLVEHRLKTGFPQRLDTRVEELDAASKTVRLVGGERLTAFVIMIATGVSRRKLEVPGEDQFEGRGIIDSGARDVEKARGKRVVVVGGGDAAFENALNLSSVAADLVLVHRRAQFSARPEFLEAVQASPTRIFTETRVKQIKGGSKVESVELERSDGSHFEVPSDVVLIRIGVRPNSELLADQAALDPAGYVIVDSLCRTSAEGVFAIGDVANPVAPTISSAAGMGSTAAKAAKQYLRNRAPLP